jgi:intracellular sulfur oxidation DsrE/DsrF family protein
MKKCILFLLMMGALYAETKVHKVVFDLTTANLEEFEKKVLSGIAFHKIHYEANFEELEVSVVIHGGAYKFFVKEPQNFPFKDDKALQNARTNLEKRIASMSEMYDVKFLMCKSGATKLNITQKDIYTFVSFVPTSTTALINKQNEGFAYIPIGD